MTFVTGKVNYLELKVEREEFNIYKLGLWVPGEDETLWMSVFDTIGTKEGSKSMTFDKLEKGNYYTIGYTSKEDGEYINHTVNYIGIAKDREKISDSKAINGQKKVIYDFPLISKTFIDKITEDKRCMASYVGIGCLLYPKAVNETFIQQLKNSYNEIKDK